jgi:hypothetical protein
MDDAGKFWLKAAFTSASRGQMSNHAANNAPDVRNTDVQWDGTALGLQPRIVKPETVQLVGDAR